MDRRSCIKAALFSAGALLATTPLMQACSRAPGSDPQPAAPRLPSGIRSHLGLQLFTVRNLLAQDFRGTLAAVAAIGFKELEMFGFGSSVFIKDPLFGMSARELKTLLDDLGVSVPTTQFSGPGDTLEQIADQVQEIGINHLILGMPSDFISVSAAGPVVSGVKDAEQMKRLAARCNAMGEVCKRAGIGFAYHNHHMEFVPVEGGLAYDVILANTDPALVKLELDLGWAKVAGIDGADYLERTPERFIACHLKDFDPKLPAAEASARSPIPAMTQLVPPGEGTIDFKRALAVMDRIGVPHGYIEIDLPDDPLAACRRGFRYLADLPAA